MIGQRRKKQQHATNSGFQVIAGCDKVAVALEAARPTKERPRSRSEAAAARRRLRYSSARSLAANGKSERG